MGIEEIQKRDKIVYARVKTVNKKWLMDQSKQRKLSEAEFLDDVLDVVRVPDAGREKRPKGRAKAARRRA